MRTFVLLLFCLAAPWTRLLGEEDTSQERDIRLLESILRSAPSGIGVVRHRVFTQVNDYILNLTGYTREELIGQPARMLYPSQEDFEFVGTEKYRQIAAHGSGRVATRWQHKDGRILDVILSSTPLDPSDLAVGVTFTVIDISDRTQAEIALRESEERFLRIFRRSPGPLVVSEITTGEFPDVNDAWVTMLGHSREDHIGKTSLDLGIWADIGARDRAIARLLDQGFFRDQPIRFLTREGEMRYALWSGEVLSLGGREVLLSLILDETERRQAEIALAWRTRWFLVGVISFCLTLLGLVISLLTSLRQRSRTTLALRASEENLQATLLSIGDAVIATDAEGRVTRMNPIAERLTGWSEPDASGRSLQEVFTIINAESRQSARNPVEQVLASGEIVGLANHTVLVARDGSEYQIADSAAPIRATDGAVIGVVLVFRDVTEEYALRERLQMSQKMDAIGQLAGGLAHDFNNILAGILGGADLLHARLGDDPQSVRYLGMITDSAMRAADLTGKLLAFGRRQSVKDEAIDIHWVIRTTVDLLSSTVDRRISITTDLTATPSLVRGDATLLQSVFLNLGINASHAMSQGGTLCFSSRILDVDHEAAIHLSLPVPGSYLEVLVTDTGSGIPPELQHRIFEPFFTTKPQGQGSGLGLASALGTIQQHQGTIRMESTVGAGTTFHILLPITREPIAEHDQGSQAVLGSGLILLVDDEELIRESCSAMLEAAGYQVLTAADGQAAVEEFRRCQDTIDLVILDMIMPVMNGRDCFHALRSLRGDLRVLLASGFGAEEDMQDLMTQGLAGMLRKPFNAATLTRTVAEILGRGMPSDL